MGRGCTLGAGRVRAGGGAGRGGSTGLLTRATGFVVEPGARVATLARVVGTNGVLKPRGKLVVDGKLPAGGCLGREAAAKGTLLWLTPAKVGWRGLVAGKRKRPLCGPICLRG